MTSLNSKNLQFHFGRKLNRRTILRGAGVSMTLPWLNAMQGSLTATEKSSPKRFVAVTLGLGLHQDNWKPVETGRNYKSSLYLKAWKIYVTT